MLAALERTLEGLGIELRRQANVVLDTEPRPREEPARVLRADPVPGRVYLVIAPIGGVDDYRALFHEAGHTEHFANTGARLPFEFRYLGDNSVTEAYAFLLEGLTADPAWLDRRPRLPDHGDYLRHTATVRLYYHRRYAAKLAYELRAARGAGGMARRRPRLRRAPQRRPPAALARSRPTWPTSTRASTWPTTSGPGRSRSSLRTHLRERYGTRWFAQRAAGGLLRELWHEGQRLRGRRAGLRARPARDRSRPAGGRGVRAARRLVWRLESPLHDSRHVADERLSSRPVRGDASLRGSHAPAEEGRALLCRNARPVNRIRTSGAGG